MLALSRHRDLAKDLKLSLRSVASTVALVTSHWDDQRYGMVATAVMPVSLEPPCMVIAVNRSASIHNIIQKRRAFCINFLSQAHEQLSAHFSANSGERRFAVGAWGSASEHDGDYALIPFLRDAQSVIFCKLCETIPYGSHSLFLGSVDDVIRSPESDPLLYGDGSYGAFETLKGA